MSLPCHLRVILEPLEPAASTFAVVWFAVSCVSAFCLAAPLAGPLDSMGDTKTSTEKIVGPERIGTMPSITLPDCNDCMACPEHVEHSTPSYTISGSDQMLLGSNPQLHL